MKHPSLALTLLFLLLLSSLSNAQLITDEKLKLNETVELIKDQEGNLLFFLSTKDQIAAYVLNEEFTSQEKISIPLNENVKKFNLAQVNRTKAGDYEFIGLTKKEYYFIYLQNGDYQLKKARLPRSKSFKPFGDFEMNSTTRLGHFTLPNAFLVMDVDKDNQLATYYEDRNGEQEHLIQIDTDLNLYRLLRERESSQQGLSFVENMNQNSYSETASPTKLYVNQEAYLTIEEEDGTLIFQIDFMTGNYTEKKVKYDSEYDKANSLLVEDVLWQIGAKGSLMELTAHDLTTNNIVFQKTIYNKNIDKLATSDFVQKGSKYAGENAVRLFDDYAHFYKNIKHKDIALARETISGDYLLQIGYFDEVTKPNSGLMNPAIPLANIGDVMVFVRPNLSKKKLIGKEYFFYVNLGTTAPDFEITLSDKKMSNHKAYLAALKFLERHNTSHKGILENPYGNGGALAYYKKGATKNEIIFQFFEEKN